MMPLLARPLSLARITWIELINEKVIYNLFFVATLLTAASTLISQLSYVTPERIILDFSVTTARILLTFVSTIIGAILLQREFERKTYHLVAIRPVSTFEIVLGKFLGSAALLALNCGLLALLSASFFSFYGGSLSSQFADAFILIFLQCLITLSIAIALSVHSSPAITLMIVTGLYLIGTNVSQLQKVVQQASDRYRPVLSGIVKLIPNFEHFNLENKVLYQIPLHPQLIPTAFAYSLGLSLLALAAAALFLRLKRL